MPEDRETITSDDLDRIFIRAQDEQGHWKSISVQEATDVQFDTWAKSRMTILPAIAKMPWPLEERADFCNQLWQAGALYMLKKDVNLEEG